MSNELDALWTEFAAETEEHLDALERLLSDQRGGDWSRDEIAELFRYFHSLKGTFLAMGFANVEAVAHRCEDILSLVREGRAALDPPLAQVLLRAVDRLKAMREEALTQRKDAQPATDILSELARHCDAHAATTPELLPQAAADTSLSDDPEMLAIYSELLDQRLPILAGALSLELRDRAAAAETAGELAYGAEMMGFEALAERLHAIAEASGSSAPAERTGLIAAFSDLREQVNTIEEVTGNPSGAASLAAGFAVPLAPDYGENIARLSAALAGFDDKAPDDGIAGALTATADLRAVASCLGFAQTVRLLLYIEERLRMLDPADAAQIQAFRVLATRTIAALQTSAAAGADLPVVAAEALAGEWEASFRAPVSTELAATAAAQHLRPEMLATLSIEQSVRLEQALAEGRRAYEVLFELDANPDIAGDLIAWLSSAVETITSRTVYRDGANCFEFLIFSEHPLDWIRAQLAALDTERTCLRGIAELGGHQSGVMAEGEPAQVPIRAPLIRVRSETIDELMAEVGEMRTALAQLADVVQHGRIASALHAARRGGEFAQQDPRLRQQFDAMQGDLRAFKALEETLEAAHRRIWTVGLQLRVIPVDGLLGRLSRAARDLAQKLGKDIDVAIDGREVRIDKSMVDVLIDPLMHMVRNAVDHGVESRERRIALGKPTRARLSISASERGNHVDIVIADDGHGLDRAKILDKALSLGIIAAQQAAQLSEREINALIFEPGFSTAETITEISGRGVGLDVVAATLQRLGGTIDMETWPNAGTRFTLKLPVSASLLRALLVEVDSQIFALPERQIVSVLELPREAIETVAGQPIVLHRGTAVPVHHLAAALGLSKAEPQSEFVHVVILTAGSQLLALRVERVLRFQDLFLKELHPMLAASPLIGGASILGDGRAVLVLDVRGLAAPGVAGQGQAAPVMAPA
jgi:two-component system chemotaxis sensor kinase CheA